MTKCAYSKLLCVSFVLSLVFANQIMWGSSYFTLFQSEAVKEIQEQNNIEQKNWQVFRTPNMPVMASYGSKTVLISNSKIIVWDQSTVSAKSATDNLNSYQEFDLPSDLNNEKIAQIVIDSEGVFARTKSGRVWETDSVPHLLSSSQHQFSSIGTYNKGTEHLSMALKEDSGILFFWGIKNSTAVYDTNFIAVSSSGQESTCWAITRDKKLVSCMPEVARYTHEAGKHADKKFEIVLQESDYYRPKELIDKKISALSSVDQSTLALTVDGKVSSWWNSCAKKEGITKDVPSIVKSKKVTKVLAIRGAYLALADDGTLSVWGDPNSLKKIRAMFKIHLAME